MNSFLRKNWLYFFLLLVTVSFYGQNQDQIHEASNVTKIKPYVSLTPKSENSDRKKLALLLPFNLVVIESDTINSLPARLKKDKFLNMTLDFYSGALMAIDSAKAIGIPVDVSIFDSQESKLASNVLNVIIKNELQDSDAIIGPFYQNNLEKAADLLSGQNVPFISPLSKDVGTPFSNIYKSIPSNETLKSAMFDYMIKKGGNIIAVVDKKRESARSYLQTNQKDVRFAAINENGSLSVESLKSLFVKGKVNYIILETNNTSMIKWTIQTMISGMSNYKLQLVILEPNETLETDEINFENLTKLNLMYPSITRENDSYGAQIFEKEYRKINKIGPSMYATRGFDITFDTMMRLVQGTTYQESVELFATQQINNRFEYYKNDLGTQVNKGVYILYYDTDYTIKEAK